MSIKNVPIFAKILLLMSAFAVLIVASSVFATSKMKAVGASYAELIAREGAAALSMARLNRASYAAYASLGELVASSSVENNKEAVEHLTQARSDALTFLGSIGALGGGYADIAQRLQQRVLKVIDTDCANTLKLGQGTTPEDNLKAQAAFHSECKAQFFPLSKAIVSETNAVTATQVKLTADLAQMTQDTVWTTFAVVIGGTVMLLAAGFVASRAWISRPVGILTDAMQQLADGDTRVTIPDTARGDEIGAIARTLQVFKDAALEKLRIEADAVTTRQSADAERSSNDAVKATQAGELSKVVESLADGLGKISEGDLCVRLEDRFAPEYERLRADFNAAVERMQGVLSSIVAGVGTIRSGTGEISQAAEDLSRRTEQQAASLEETAAALEQITTTVKRAAEGAVQARAVVSRTRTDAEQSGRIVQNAVDAMGEIEKSSRQISQILGVMDEIAFQTNLLALNAGVEAARAGDAGRGFAVVASEVRALAQRSAEAAREIKALISASTTQVGAGVKLVGETGAALQRIVVQVGEVDTVVSEIAGSAQEQATGLAQVNIAVTEMDQVTQQNAAMVEQSTAASRALANETESLATLTSHFRLGNDAKNPPAPQRTGKPARPAPSAKPRARGNQALALVPANADREWQEF